MEIKPFKDVLASHYCFVFYIYIKKTWYFSIEILLSFVRNRKENHHNELIVRACSPSTHEKLETCSFHRKMETQKISLLREM